jgi:hypothetical protein
MIVEEENKTICSLCGGNCCRKMGCQFSPDDFEDLSFEALKAEIEKGFIGIDWWEGDIDEQLNELDRVFFLRMRNRNKPVVDPSWGGESCILWNEEKGCPLLFEKRPKGARALLPRQSPEKCIDGYSKEMCVADWRKHHEILKKLKEYFYKENNL